MAGAVKKKINVRAKGQNGEREVVKLLQPVVDRIRKEFELHPIILKRNSMQSDRGGSDIAGIPFLAIEVKFQKTELLTSWWNQCVRQAEPGQTPILIFRKNRTLWKVMMHGYIGGPNSMRLLTTVIVDVEDFMRWFGLAYIQYLSENVS